MPRKRSKGVQQRRRNLRPAFDLPAGSTSGDLDVVHFVLSRTPRNPSLVFDLPLDLEDLLWRAHSFKRRTCHSSLNLGPVNSLFCLVSQQQAIIFVVLDLVPGPLTFHVTAQTRSAFRRARGGTRHPIA